MAVKADGAAGVKVIEQDIIFRQRVVVWNDVAA
jgi:hypothetical protein